MFVRPAKFYVLMALALILLSLFAWAGYRMTPESAPVARGAAYATVRGCVACHGVPGNQLADANDAACSDGNQMPWHPEYDVDCTDVLAYFETVRLRRNFGERLQTSMDNPIVHGEYLARKYHCFNCHGHLGQGGFKNSKSLKGYVPGYFGSDFKNLTRNANHDSVRQWILHGVDAAILDKPVTGRIAMFFFGQQAVSMPSYKSLEPEEIEILTNYVIALHQFGPMTAKIVRSYGEQAQSTDGPVSADNGHRSMTLSAANEIRQRVAE